MPSTLVEVKGMGIVEFPEGMTQEDIVAALGSLGEGQPGIELAEPDVAESEPLPTVPLQPTTEDPGTLEGVYNSLIRGWHSGQQGDALVDLIEADKRGPTMGQEYQAYRTAQDDPRYLLNLLKANQQADPLQFLPSDVPSAAELKAESLYGPERKLDMLRTRQEEEKQWLAGEIARRQEKIDKLPSTQAVEAFNQSEGMDAAKAFISNPFEITANLIAQSTSQSYPAIAQGVIGGLAAGPAGTAIGGAAGAFEVEYAAKIVDSFREAGIDLTDPDAVMEGLKDKKRLAQFHDAGVRRGVPIAALTFVGGGLAGKFLGKVLGKGVGPVSGALAKETGVQSGLEGMGELLAQIAADEEISMKEVFAEAIASGGQNVAEVSVNITKELQRQKKANEKRIAEGKEARRKVAKEIIDEKLKKDVPPLVPIDETQTKATQEEIEALQRDLEKRTQAKVTEDQAKELQKAMQENQISQPKLTEEEKRIIQEELEEAQGRAKVEETEKPMTPTEEALAKEEPQEVEVEVEDLVIPDMGKSKTVEEMDELVRQDRARSREAKGEQIEYHRRVLMARLQEARDKDWIDEKFEQEVLDAYERTKDPSKKARDAFSMLLANMEVYKDPEKDAFPEVSALRKAQQVKDFKEGAIEAETATKEIPEKTEEEVPPQPTRPDGKDWDVGDEVTWTEDGVKRTGKLTDIHSYDDEYGWTVTVEGVNDPTDSSRPVIELDRMSPAEPKVTPEKIISKEEEKQQVKEAIQEQQEEARLERGLPAKPDEFEVGEEEGPTTPPESKIPESEYAERGMNKHGVHEDETDINLTFPKARKTEVKIGLVQDKKDQSWRSSYSVRGDIWGTSAPASVSSPAYPTAQDAAEGALMAVQAILINKVMSEQESAKQFDKWTGDDGKKRAAEHRRRAERTEKAIQDIKIQFEDIKREAAKLNQKKEKPSKPTTGPWYRQNLNTIPKEDRPLAKKRRELEDKKKKTSADKRIAEAIDNYRKLRSQRTVTLTPAEFIEKYANDISGLELATDLSAEELAAERTFWTRAGRPLKSEEMDSFYNLIGLKIVQDSHGDRSWNMLGKIQAAQELQSGKIDEKRWGDLGKRMLDQRKKELSEYLKRKGKKPASKKAKRKKGAPEVEPPPAAPAPDTVVEIPEKASPQQIKDTVVKTLETELAKRELPEESNVKHSKPVKTGRRRTITSGDGENAVTATQEEGSSYWQIKHTKWTDTKSGKQQVTTMGEVKGGPAVAEAANEAALADLRTGEEGTAGSIVFKMPSQGILKVRKTTVALQETLKRYKKLSTASGKPTYVFKEKPPTKNEAQAWLKEAEKNAKDPKFSLSDYTSKIRKPLGLTADEVWDEMQKAVDKWPDAPTVYVYQSVDELPVFVLAQIAAMDAWDIEGFVRDADGSVYLVADNIVDLQRAREVLAHEIIGHIGVRAALGRDYDSFMRRVYDQYKDTKVGKRIAQVYGTNDPVAIGEEVVARLAEGRLEDRSLWQKIVQAMKDFWKRITGNEIMEREIRQLLNRAEQSLGGNVSGFMKMSLADMKPLFHRLKGRLGDYIQVPVSPMNPELGESRVDQLHDQIPNPLTSTARWRQWYYQLTGNREVLVAPYRAMRYMREPNILADQLQDMTTSQIQSAEEGMKVAKKVRKYYRDGRTTADHTGLYFLWSILSRGTPVYAQESAFIDAHMAGVDHFIREAVEGRFGKRELGRFKRWVKTVFQPGFGLEGTSATHNLNAFANNFLTQMSKPYQGKSRLQTLHEWMASDMSSNEIRRNFLKMMGKDNAGFDTKILSFTLMVTGRDDVIVMDRIQFRNFWDNKNRINQYGVKNIYDGYPMNSGMSQLFGGWRSIALYEALESSLEGPVKQAYELAGRKKDASLGRFHWDVWVQSSDQDVSHGSTVLISRMMEGLEDPGQTVGVRQGKWTTWTYGVNYVIVGNKPELVMRDDKGNWYQFSPSDLYNYRNELRNNITKRTTPAEERVLPQRNNLKDTGKWELEEGYSAPAHRAIIQRHGRRLDHRTASGLESTHGPIIRSPKIRFSLSSARDAITQRAKRAFTRDEVANDLSRETDISSTSPEAERRFNAAKLTTRPIWERAQEGLSRIRKYWTRHFPFLDSRTDGTLIDILRQHEAIPEWAKVMSAHTLADVTRGLGPNKYKLFTKLVILPDLVQDIEKGLYEEGDNLPFGYKNLEEIQADLAKLIVVMNEQATDVREALIRRRRFMHDLRDELVERDLLPKEVQDFSEYYHHQVLQYYQAKRDGQIMTSGPSEVRQKKQPWQRKRKGSELDYSTDYLEAELSVISSALAQMATQDTLAKLKEQADILPQLKKRAKMQNLYTVYGGKANYDRAQAIRAEIRVIRGSEDAADSATRQRIASLLEELSQIDPLRPFRLKKAASLLMAGKVLSTTSLDVPARFENVATQLAEQWEMRNATEEEIQQRMMEETEEYTSEEFFGFLNWMAEQEGEVAAPALGFWKAIVKERAFIKETAGKKFVTFQSRGIMPEDHTVWQPERGNHFYWANTVQEKAMEAFLRGERTLGEEDFKKALALAGPKTQWVIPTRLADTLDNFTLPPDHAIEKVLGAGIRAWKRWTLLNPLRVLKYNFNNASGDYDIVFAYQPQIVRGSKKAAAELYAFHIKRQQNEELNELIRKGVLSSGWAGAEVTGLKEEEFFAVLEGRRPNLIMRYWRRTQDWTQWREDILRLAAYRYFDQRLQEPDAENVYGVSQRSELEAMRRDEVPRQDIAAKLARELVGDYGNISMGGQWLRTHVVPFWSWMEINAPRYYRLFKNARYEADHGSRLAQRMGIATRAGVRGLAINTASIAFKIFFFYGMANLWNHLFFRDEEEELAEGQRRQLHIILGRREDNSIRTLRLQGALSDALGWVGLEDAPSDITDLITGDKTWEDQLAEMGKAPVNRLINGSWPIKKTIVEALWSRTSFPDVFNMRPVRDPWAHVAGLFSGRDLYNWLAKRPVRDKGAVENLAKLITYTTDPGEAAYFVSKSLVSKWEEKQGRDPAKFIPGYKANMLYYYKQALKYGDQPLAETYLNRYYDMGGTEQGAATSIARSAPMGNLSADRQQEFYESLTPKQQRTVDRAMEWYERTFY